MTFKNAHERLSPLLLWVLSIAAVLVVSIIVLFLRPASVSKPMSAPGLTTPVDASSLAGEGYDVTVAILRKIYAAFSLTDEAAIYDGLAEVAAGEALESLYLERAGALASGGLPDQLLPHER